MENLKSFLDGELDLAGNAEVETHLRQDADLAKMSADFSALSVALKGVDPGQPYGMEQLQSRLSTTSVAESKKIWRFAGWSSVMGVLLVVAMIPSLKGGGGSGSAESRPAAEFKSQPQLGASSASPPAAPLSIADSATAAADMMPDQMEPAKKSETEKDGLAGERSNDTDFYLSPRTKRAQASALPRPRVATGGLLPAEDEAKLNMSIGKNSPGAPYGVYLEKSGNLSVEVQDLMRAVDEATGMVTGLKGFVVTSDMQNTEKGGSARMTLRIPSDNFPAAMNKLQGMGEVRQVNSASQDITGETVTSAAKTRSWADQEKQLIGELAKSRNRDEKWRIRGELSNVRANLEAEKSQLNNLKERGNFSTIEVTFTRGASGGGWAKGAFGDATSGLGSVGQIVGTIGIYFLVFIPVWLPLAIAGWMVNRRRR
ncbi:MAG: DUF4349 domain-containing protein [Fimbriimonas sp.]|nr:DUF4349 domain-containing protein [Fimbriimonas sp.]